MSISLLSQLLGELGGNPADARLIPPHLLAPPEVARTRVVASIDRSRSVFYLRLQWGRAVSVNEARRIAERG